MTTPKTTASAREAMEKALVGASALLAEVAGASLGIAMSGKNHPNPDEVLTDIYHKASAMSTQLADLVRTLDVDAALAESAGDAKAEPESAPAAEPLPRDVGVVLDAVRGALDGRPYALRDAFVWAGTPQGDDFWRAQDNALRLSPEGAAILRATLADREG